MKRAETFFNLVFGWRDSESGYGAGYHISPEVRAFFMGWMGGNCPLEYLRPEVVEATNQGRHAGSAFPGKLASMEAFANRLEELSAEIKHYCSYGKEQPDETGR